MTIDYLYKVFSGYFRKYRNVQFVALMGLTPETTLLDVGGTSDFWKSMPVKPKVTLLNIYKDPDEDFPQITGSACDIPLPDQSFDIVFSNSMIEHLGTWECQQKAAKEMLRVGKNVWVQTPYRWFPMEPHLLTPFIHWFPFEKRRQLLRFTLWAYLKKPSAEYYDEMWREIRLLNIPEMKQLFPNCQMIYEKFGFLIKSMVAVRQN